MALRFVDDVWLLLLFLLETIFSYDCVYVLGLQTFQSIDISNLYFK